MFLTSIAKKTAIQLQIVYIRPNCEHVYTYAIMHQTITGHAANGKWCAKGPWMVNGPGQTDSQVDASWKLRSTYDPVWPGLACTCADLGWLAHTLVEINFARKSTQVFHRLATQPKSTQVEWRPLTYYQPMKHRICLPWNGFVLTWVYFNVRKHASPFGTQRKSLVTTCDCVWPRL